MGFATPEAFDYSQWKEPLESKVRNACGDEWMFKAPSWTFSQKMFRNLQNTLSAEALEDYMLGDGTLSHYLNTRGGFLFMLILGIVILIATIFVAIAVCPKVRTFYSKVCCGACGHRDRPRMKQVQEEVRASLLMRTALVGFAAVALLAVQIVASARMLADIKKVDCGMWLELYGHFYGVESLSKDLTNDVTANIAWSWGGTQPLLESLSQINDTTNPHNPNNGIRTKLYNGLDELKANATAKSRETGIVIDEWVALSDAWWGMGTNCSAGDTFNGTWSEFNVGTANAVAYKAKVYKNEILETLDTAWVTIEDLLERYAGESSDLLGKAEAATTDAVSTINQMNAVLGALTQKWDHLGPHLIRAMRAIAALLIILCFVVFILAPTAMYLAIKLVSQMKQDTLPTFQQRRAWSYTFISVMLTAGFAGLYCGLTFFMVGLGNDVCDLLEDGVLTRGVWEVLGDDILHPEGVTDIDVPRILDTCILQEGDGNVAAALALDARIAELAVEVDRAKEVVLETRDELLERDTRTLRVQIVRTGAEDMMDFIYRTPMRDDQLVDGAVDSQNSDFNHRPLLSDLGVPAPWFNASWTPSSQSVLLCIIPGSADNGGSGSKLGAWGLLAYNCQKLGRTGIEIRPVPLNIFYDALNSQLPSIRSEAGITTDLPEAFCSQTGESEGFACSTNAYTLTKDDFKDWPTTYNTVWQNALVKPTYTSDPSIGWKAWRTLLALGRLETFMQTRISETNATSATGTITCPLGAPDCTIHSAIKASRAKTKEVAPRLDVELQDLFALFDFYVDNITIGSMSSVVDDAYQVVEGANCQFEGTALNAAAIMPLCQAIFPATTVTSLLMALMTIVLCLLGSQLWKWYHFMDDLAQLHGDDPGRYDEAKISFATMSQRREFVELYTGVPIPENRGSAIGATPLASEDRVHQDREVTRNATSARPQHLMQEDIHRAQPSESSISSVNESTPQVAVAEALPSRSGSKPQVLDYPPSRSESSPSFDSVSASRVM